MPINDAGEFQRSINDAPRGMFCPYCNTRECNRTTIINKELKWLCEVCFKEILEYEQERRQTPAG